MSFIQRNIKIILIIFSIVAFIVFYILSVKLFDTNTTFKTILNTSLKLNVGDEIVIDNENVGLIRKIDTIKNNPEKILATLRLSRNLHIPDKSYIQYHSNTFSQIKQLEIVLVPSRSYYDKYDTIYYHDTSSSKQIIEQISEKIESDTIKPFVTDTVKQLPLARENEIIYKVQFITSKDEIPLGSSRLKGIRDMDFYRDRNIYKYTTGNMRDFDQSIKYCEDIKALGFPDAFVVAFQGGKRIPVKEARQLQKK